MDQKTVSKKCKKLHDASGDSQEMTGRAGTHYTNICGHSTVVGAMTMMSLFRIYNKN